MRIQMGLSNVCLAPALIIHRWVKVLMITEQECQGVVVVVGGVIRLGLDPVCVFGMSDSSRLLLNMHQ